MTGLLICCALFVSMDPGHKPRLLHVLLVLALMAALNEASR